MAVVRRGGTGCGRFAPPWAADGHRLDREVVCVTNVDLAQTIVDAAGVAAPDRMQGRSFWRDLTGGIPLPEPDGMYYRYYENDDPIHHALAHYGFRTDRYKIIHFYNDGMGLPGSGSAVFPPEWELYDLQEDPDEVRNVHGDPRYARISEELTVRMWRRQHELGDTPHPSQPVPAGVTAKEGA